jgi:formylglycine-generating enzyme required for sulfatase activity
MGHTATRLAIVLVLTLLGCGEPTVHSGTVGGGEAPGTLIVNADGGTVVGDGLGTNANGGEGPGIAPSCTDVDISKVPKTELADVPAGSFRMGCNDALDRECREDEKPAHDVSVSAFKMDKTEVTTAQWFVCVSAGKCTYPKCPWDPCVHGNYPMSCLTREQAESYCAFVGGRVPTEAEWEKAARGTDARIYPWGNDAVTCALANMDGCAKDLEPVGAHPGNASPYGVLDLAGNVVEWTRDFYDAHYYQSSPPVDPSGPPTGTHYVGRGGGYLSEAIWQRASSRDSYPAGYTRISMGVRCVR